MPSFQKPPTVSDDYRAVDIYRKAAKIIFAKGFTATSMGDIADAVDLTKGGLYYYIKGKEALLFAIMNFAMDLIENEVLVEASHETRPQGRLALLLAGHIRLVLRDPSPMTILVYEGDHLSVEHLAKIQVRKNEHTAFLRETIQAVLDLRGISPIDASIAALGFLEMIHSLVRWHRQQGSLSRTASDADVVVHLTRLALRSLSADDSKVADWLTEVLRTPEASSLETSHEPVPRATATGIATPF